MEKYNLRVSQEAETFNQVACLQRSITDKHTWMDTFEEGLFYRVPHTLISYIEGAGVCMVEISFNENTDSCTFTVHPGQ